MFLHPRKHKTVRRVEKYKAYFATAHIYNPAHIFAAPLLVLLYVDAA
jgi:hypothetical protein